jgi:flagellar hook-length control protein FliK
MPINLFDLGSASTAATVPTYRPKSAGRGADGIGPTPANRQVQGDADRPAKDARGLDKPMGKPLAVRKPADAAHAHNRVKGPKGAKSDDHGHDPFMAVIREAVAILNKAVKATSEAEASTAAAPGLDAPAPDADVTAALNLLAQMAQFAQGAPQQASAGDVQGPAAAMAGIGAIDSLTAGASGQLHLDPQLLQALFGQPATETADAAAGMTAPGHLPLGQPLPPEMLAELRDLRAQVGQLQQQLASLLKEHGGPAVVLPATDTAAPVAAAPAPETVPAVPETATAPVTPVVVPVPVTPVAAAPADAPKTEKATAAVPRPASSAAAQRQAAIDMLLKPLRGELTVESGDFALKGLRTDVAYEQPVADAKLLQNLVEQGKQVANQLPEGKVTLADAMGIRNAADHDDAAVPVAQTEAGNVLLDALTDEAVPATSAGHAAQDRADDGTEAPVEMPQVRTDEALAGKLALGQADGAGGVTAADGPRAQQSVMQQVIDKVKELTPGPAQVRMVLNPESLGQVTIRLVAHQGEVSVRIITESADAQKLLDGGMNHLKAALADSGIRIDQATVVSLPAQSEHRQDGHAHQRQQPEQGQARREAPREMTAEEQAALDDLTALMQGRSA